MINHVWVSLPANSDSKVYTVTYKSGRTVTMLQHEAPATVRRFLNAHAATARTVRVPHLDNGSLCYTYYVVY